MNYSDQDWIKKALRLAEKAFSLGEVPVGAIVVKENRIIGQGYNQREGLNDPTAHAEIIAITAAASTIGDWRLNDCTIYVTKEPCPMCAGAIINSRVSKLIFGSYDDKKGCCGSLYQLCGDKRLESITAVKGGVLDEQCSAILKEFFRLKRN
ncbi:MAG: nucleoside deaminase [bacterium TMED46]|nr:MAG: nucleoside deaminase [bacterium TMED46]